MNRLLSGVAIAAALMIAAPVWRRTTLAAGIPGGSGPKPRRPRADPL